MSVHLMTASQWPSYRPSMAPSTIRAMTAAFEQYYKRRTLGQRRLTWVHSLGRAVVSLRLPLGTKDVAANVLQASILMTLGELGGAASAGELAEALGVAEPSLKPHLDTLIDVAAGSNVLMLAGAGGQTYRFNGAFKSSKRRFKLPQAKQLRRAGRQI